MTSEAKQDATASRKIDHDQIFRAQSPARHILALVTVGLLVFTAITMMTVVVFNVSAEVRNVRNLFADQPTPEEPASPWDSLTHNRWGMEPDVLKIAFGDEEEFGGEEADHDLAHHHEEVPQVECARPHGAEHSASSNPTRVYAFVPAELEDAQNAMARTCDTVNVVIPEWLMLDGEGLSWLFDAEDEANVPYVILASAFDDDELMPLVHVQADALDDMRSRAWVDTLQLVNERDWLGMCFDLRRLEFLNLQRAFEMLVPVRDAYAAAGKEACAVISPDQMSHLPDAKDQPDRIVVPVVQDAYVLGTYTEAPAPLAWVDQVVRDAMRRIPQDRLVIGMATGGVHWHSERRQAEYISFSETMALSARNDAFIGIDSVQGHGLVSYTDEEGAPNLIWFLDAISHYRQLQILADNGLASVAVWGLGREDPSIWQVLTHKDIFEPAARDELRRIDLNSFVSYHGTGPFIRFGQDGQVGVRDLAMSEEGDRIEETRYVRLPAPVMAERYGSIPDNTVLLTFDDGPTKNFTPKILDILEAENVPAAFFMIGRQMGESREIVERMQREGFDYGLHTYSHPRIERTSAGRMQIELALQSRLFSWLTGTSPTVFRAPYLRGPGPLEGEVASRLRDFTEGRFHILGASIVPPDWRTKDATALVDYTLSQLDGSGQVILLHDGGGDRTHTIETLRLLIPALRAKGYDFASLTEIMAEIGPTYTDGGETEFESFEAVFYSGVADGGVWIALLVPMAVGLGLLRGATIFGFALRAHGRSRQRRAFFGPELPPYCPDVTVLIPAYNEEDVILRTIGSVLDSTYDRLKVLVIDDGSTDDTYQVVQDRYGDDPSVKIVTKENGGKWRASNLAFEYIDTEVVVAIDADTVIAPDAIENLVQPLRDPKVGAVAGKIVVGNPGTLLARLEKLEYSVAQNVDRQAYESFNAIMVVPGAFGAWRADAVRACGLYSGDTLAEDTDLTISMLERGYKVRSAANAYAFTEAPATVGPLMKQRLRWSIGMIQSAWKHRRTIRAGEPIGLIGLTDLLLFGVIMPFLGPIIDILLLIMLVRFVGSFDGTSFQSLTIRDYAMWAVFIALPVMEVAMASFAIRCEPTAKRSLLWLIVLNRLFYRQLLMVNVYRSIWRILTGRLTGWNKLKRLGGVQVVTPAE
ncbi:glycosyltransferase [Maritimibacter sp. DP1N21-5]|uniref:glycosyltransferase n=1 Tax=Maritimibacter sp. DP1N21-5 TaxID=2836867 RepID=UPI001C450D05|nr:glycosyltransferase [Maritimibacter sp. DP1N21-5]MBV7410364.1 glycosyltransferase [Maritimibacter sp. DP1N21-5]